jgi:hypothetical protein
MYQGSLIASGKICRVLLLNSHHDGMYHAGILLQLDEIMKIFIYGTPIALFLLTVNKIQRQQ